MIHPDDYGTIFAMFGMIAFIVLIAFAARDNQPVAEGRTARNRSSDDAVDLPDTYEHNTAESGPWQVLREKVLARDGNMCTMCGSVSKLQVDHIQELSLGGTNELSNLRTLCVSCHEDRHGRQFTREEYYTDRRYGENYQLNPKVAKLLKSSRSGIGIKYKDRNAHYSERVIYTEKIWSDPKTHRVYVKGFDELDGDVRIFKLSRMKLCDSRLNFNAEDGRQSDSDMDVINQWLKRNDIE